MCYLFRTALGGGGNTTVCIAVIWPKDWLDQLTRSITMATHESDSKFPCIRFRNYIRFRSSVRHYSSDGYSGSSVIALRSSRAHAPSRHTDWAGTPTAYASACPRGHMWRCTDSNVTKRRGTFSDMFCTIKDKHRWFTIIERFRFLRVRYGKRCRHVWRNLWNKWVREPKDRQTRGFHAIHLYGGYTHILSVDRQCCSI